DAARPRPARLRAGPEDGGFGRRQCRSDHLDDVRDRRRARRRRRHALFDVLRRRLLLRWLRARREGLHRRGARRHWLAARRRDRRLAHRPDRDDVVGLLLHRLQGRRRLFRARHRAHLPAAGPVRPAGRREGVTMAEVQAQRSDVTAAFRDAALTALIALGVFLPLIGFQTINNIHNEIVLTTRWPLLFALVAIIGCGRLCYALAVDPWLRRRALRPVKAEVPAWRTFVGKWFVPFAIGFVIVYPAIILGLVGFRGALKWVDNFGIQILIYMMLGWGLNIVVGLAGLLDLGYVAFYAVGAYSYALLAKEFGFSFWILLPLAGCLASFWGVLLGFPVLRLRGDYLAIVTLA